LWRYPPDFRTAELTLDGPDGPLSIRPDPRQSLREHLELLFRDAGGNLALLRLANPYDLWMHVEGGPGAHVLVRREQGREIPSRCLEEAANLALAKSWRRDEAKAGVVCAQARHVRPVKGGKPGSVRVDKVECVLDVRLDPDIELRIARLEK
jgi:hypothetical protein